MLLLLPSRWATAAAAATVCRGGKPQQTRTRQILHSSISLLLPFTSFHAAGAKIALFLVVVAAFYLLFYLLLLSRKERRRRNRSASRSTNLSWRWQICKRDGERKKCEERQQEREKRKRKRERKKESKPERGSKKD